MNKVMNMKNKTIEKRKVNGLKDSFWFTFKDVWLMNKAKEMAHWQTDTQTGTKTKSDINRDGNTHIQSGAKKKRNIGIIDFLILDL